MKKEKRHKHALSNERVCRLLVADGNCPDWVITTAFYTAIQLLSFKIFPIKEKTKDGHEYQLRTLDEYHRHNNIQVSKHEALADLIYTNFPSIGADFKWLMDLCNKARYKDYDQSKTDADRAVKLLDTIKANISFPATYP